MWPLVIVLEYMEKIIWIRGGIVLKLMVVIVGQKVIELNKKGEV
jgi:hypothetical protein